MKNYLDEINNLQAFLKLRTKQANLILQTLFMNQEIAWMYSF